MIRYPTLGQVLQFNEEFPYIPLQVIIDSVKVSDVQLDMAIELILKRQEDNQKAESLKKKEKKNEENSQVLPQNPTRV